MGDSDGKTWIEEARSYERLRRRYWQFTLAIVGSWIVFVGLLFLDRAELFPLICFLFVLGFPICCICCICWGSLTQYDLMNFICPRCGMRFVVGRWSKWPTDRCKHCGLDLGSMAKAAEKPTITMDPLE